jgi:hypothetical protein
VIVSPAIFFFCQQFALFLFSQLATDEPDICQIPLKGYGTAEERVAKYFPESIEPNKDKLRDADLIVIVAHSQGYDSYYALIQKAQHIPFCSSHLPFKLCLFFF